MRERRGSRSRGRLLGGLGAGMFLLAGRGLAAGALAGQVWQARAGFLVRVRSRAGRPGSPGRAALPRRLLAAGLRRGHGPEEVPALVATCQAVRTAVAGAAGTVPGTGPGRGSLTVARNTRDQVILAAGVTAGPVTGLAGDTGRAVLAGLVPARRLRVSPRAVKRALSRYRALGQIDRATCWATIGIVIIASPLTNGNQS